MNNSYHRSCRESLNQSIELLAVLVIGFGIFIYSSTLSVLDNIKAPTEQVFTSFDFYFIVCYEVIALAIIISILKKRTWKLQDFNLEFKTNMVFVALILIALRYIASYLLYQGLMNTHLLDLETIPKSEITLDLSIFSILLMIIVNSAFEEIILIGYLFKRLENFNVAFIIIFSIIIRVSFHTYQGVEEIPKIIALGLVLGLYYSRYKKLWPVILTHGIGNLIVFLNYEYNWINS